MRDMCAGVMVACIFFVWDISIGLLYGGSFSTLFGTMTSHLPEVAHATNHSGTTSTCAVCALRFRTRQKPNAGLCIAV
jgi:hypothetical protein